MQELAGRLTALDPEVGAILKVVSYFNTLVGHEAGIETLPRGAAVPWLRWTRWLRRARYGPPRPSSASTTRPSSPGWPPQ
jgi:hypothetical protein